MQEKTLIVIYKQLSEGTTSTEYVGDMSLKEKLKKQYLVDALMELTK